MVFSVTWMADILAAFLYFIKPFLFRFTAAKIVFHDKPRTILYKNAEIFGGIIGA